MTATDSREAKRDDRRSSRSQRMLGEALVSLMQEKRYDAITVQEIIDRADVGRSTFYAHYLDKEDLLQSEMARVIGSLDAHMDRGTSSNLIIPSLELLRHLKEYHGLYRALVRGRAIEPLTKVMQTNLSRHVQFRLVHLLPPGHVTEVPVPVVAQYVAGALLTLFQWWVDREMPELPEQIDQYFLQLVRPSVLANTGIDI